MNYVVLWVWFKHLKCFRQRPTGQKRRKHFQPFLCLQHYECFTSLVLAIEILEIKKNVCCLGTRAMTACRSTGHDPVAQSHQWGSRCQTGWLQRWKWPCGRSWPCCPGADSPPWWSLIPSSWLWSLEPPGWVDTNQSLTLLKISQLLILFGDGLMLGMTG